MTAKQYKTKLESLQHELEIALKQLDKANAVNWRLIHGANESKPEPVTVTVGDRTITIA